MKKITFFLTLFLAFAGSKAQASTDDGLLDRSTWTITTSSECTDNSSTGYGHAEHIIDGNTASYWHTYWSGADDASGDQTEELAQYFIIDLGSDLTFNSFAYLPRATSGGAANGTATQIKMFVSTSEFDVSGSTAADVVNAQSDPVFDMDLDYSNDKFTQYKIGTLSSNVTGRYVMFVITAANVGAVTNKYASCSEFYLGSNGDASYYSLIDESKITALESSVGTALLQVNPSAYNEFKSKYDNKTLTITEYYNTLNNVSSLYNFPEAGKYYRFVAKKNYSSNVLGMNGSNVNVTASSALNTDVNNIWKLVANGDAVMFQNPNTGNYIGALTAATVSSTTPPTLTTSDEASKFTFSWISDNMFYILNSDSHKMNCEETGGIDYWDNTTAWNGATVESNRWLITEATSLEVALASVDGQTNTYASAYLPVSVSSVSGATAYLGALSEDNSTLKMTAATAGVPAETGFVLVGESGATTATLTLGESTTSASDNSLTGTLSTITLGDDNPRASYLAFGVNSGTVGFYTPSSSVATIPANKAFIDATKLSASAIAMQFGNTPTGISNATIATAGAAAPVFDLSGRRVANPTKGGIYIQNGKKFVK